MIGYLEVDGLRMEIAEITLTENDRGEPVMRFKSKPINNTAYRKGPVRLLTASGKQIPDAMYGNPVILAIASDRFGGTTTVTYDVHIHWTVANA